MTRMKWYLSAHNPRDDTGAALIAVVLLVSVMAIGATLTFETVGYSIKRTGALRTFDQAFHYARGSEQLSASVAENLHSEKFVLTQPQVVSFPIDGGRIEGLISDKSNCFNINSLIIRQQTGAYVVNEVTGQHYLRLLLALGLADRQAEQLVASLSDWLDSDTRVEPLGAEDYDYGALEKPYRAANGPMKHVSELYLVKGYEPEVVDVLMPFLCADDSTEPSALNVNSLNIDQAPLLSALIGGNFSVQAAIEIILARPGKGYGDIADFWLDPALAAREVAQPIRRQTTVKPHRFESRVRVTYFDAISHLTSEIRVDDAGTARIVRHHMGVLP